MITVFDWPYNLILETNFKKSKPGYRDKVECKLFRKLDGVLLYEWVYGYSCEDVPFCPFIDNQLRICAIFYSDYSLAHVLRIEGDTARVIAKESISGFCGIKLREVSKEDDYFFEKDGMREGNFLTRAEDDCCDEFGRLFKIHHPAKGVLVYGCVWGGGSYQLMFFDISKIEEGKLLKDSRFGLVEIDGDISKMKYITPCREEYIRVPVSTVFHLPTGRMVIDYDNDIAGIASIDWGDEKLYTAEWRRLPEQL